MTQTSRGEARLRVAEQGKAMQARLGAARHG